MIKAIFFDFDGVLAIETTGADAISRALSEQTGIPIEVLSPVYHRHADHLVKNHKRYETILKPLNDELKTNLTIEDIVAATKTSTHNKDMLTLAQDLRSAGYITGIITDNNADRIDVLRELFNLNDFSPLIVSGDIGHGKWQDATIFEIALAQASVKPHESLFIDNTSNNLLVPERMGMQTYWHDDQINDVPAFRSHLSKLDIKFQ